MTTTPSQPSREAAEERKAQPAQPVIGETYVFGAHQLPLLYLGHDPQHKDFHTFAHGDFARGEALRFLLIRDMHLSLAGNRVLDRTHAYTEIPISPNKEEDAQRRALIDRALVIYQEHQKQEACHG